jgi:hypothetical protein
MNDAKGAVSRTMGLIGAELGRGTSVGAWTGEHPWVALSAAAVAGFTVASLVIPTKEQQALRKLEKLERALHPPPPERDRADHHGNGHDADRRDKPGLLGSLLREIVHTGMPALSYAFAAAMGGQPAATKATSNDGTTDTGDPPKT